MCVCTCVQVWESYYGMAKYVHIYLFPILIHLLLCHPESCPVMYHEICNRWDLGQSRSFMVPCHTWDSPARQVVLKTWVIHRNGSTAVSEHHPKIGKTFRWAGSFKFPRNFHQPQRRGNISEGQHGTKHSLGFSHPGRLASVLYFFLPSYSPGLTHPLPVLPPVNSVPGFWGHCIGPQWLCCGKKPDATFSCSHQLFSDGGTKGKPGFRIIHIVKTSLGFPDSSGNTGSIPGLERSPGEGNGNPLQYSCLGNPMDRGAWQTTVHGVAKSWTQLSD